MVFSLLKHLWDSSRLLLQRIILRTTAKSDATSGPGGGVNSGGGGDGTEDEIQDHPLLKKFGSHREYTTSYARYPSIRTFYHPHAHADKLQTIAELPLFVFMHGLGGSLPQFAPLLGSFVNIAPCFGIELPGHGMSEFSPRNFEAYTFAALTELWKVAINDICDRHGHRKVVFICHSFGCSVGASLTAAITPSLSSSSTATTAPTLLRDVSTLLAAEVQALVAICPKATPPTEKQARTFRRLLTLPDFVLNIMRWFDRRGGESSHSVARFVDKTSGSDLKRLQLRFNRQFRTPVWKRISLGCLPEYDSTGTPHGGLPGQAVWECIRVPLYLVAGESDGVTKPAEVSTIIGFLQGETRTTPATDESPQKISSVVSTTDSRNAPTDSHSIKSDVGIATTIANEEDFGLKPSDHVETKSKHATVVKAVMLPTPASHALMYDHASYRTVAGLIEDFLSRHVSHTLSLGWQLQQLATSGKWDVKNLDKWKRVRPVSGPIAGGLFRALKTLREQDEEHTPAVFLREWGPDKIFAVIDISHDAPVYDTKTLEKGNIQYHKFPTVSKIPPTIVEVAEFIALVDRLEEEINLSMIQINGDEGRNTLAHRQRQRPAIGVHCHYGYNRTGFFIVCFLVERKGWRLSDAIDEFAARKPPGIKHDHFIDTLFVRYTVGLRRSSIFS